MAAKPIMEYHLVKDRNGAPLVVIDGFPEQGSDMYPHDILKLAKELEYIASQAIQISTPQQIMKLRPPEQDLER